MRSNTSLTNRRKSTSIDHNRKRRGRAHACNDRRPKHGDVEILHAAIIGRLLRYMKPELGNLSWVSNVTIANDLGLDKYTIKYHIQAAVLIGEVRIRYTCPATAHLQTSGRYPHYTNYTKGLTFTQLLAREPGKASRLNYYTIEDCHTLQTTKLYPDWMLRVIKLCASQKAAKVKQAKELAQANEFPGSERKVVDKACWRKYVRRKPTQDKPVQTITDVVPETGRNEGADPLVSVPPPAPRTAINEGVRPPEPLLSNKEDGLRHKGAVAQSAREKSDRDHQRLVNELRARIGKLPLYPEE